MDKFIKREVWENLVSQLEKKQITGSRDTGKTTRLNTKFPTALYLDLLKAENYYNSLSKIIFGIINTLSDHNYSIFYTPPHGLSWLDHKKDRYQKDLVHYW